MKLYSQGKVLLKKKQRVDEREPAKSSKKKKVVTLKNVHYLAL